MMTTAQRARWRMCLAIGMSIGVGQIVFRSMSASHGMLLGIAGCMLVSALMACGVSYACARLIRTSDG